MASVPPKLKFVIQPKHRRLSQPEGPFGRIKKLQKLVAAVVRYERIETTWNYADETRGYVERLIQDAVRNGPTHKRTMEMAKYWLVDPDLVHKLFKVLVPRFQMYTVACTSMFPLPMKFPGSARYQGILELKGNPYPPVVPHHRDNKNSLLNILLTSAQEEYREEKLSEKLSKLNVSMAPVNETELSDSSGQIAQDDSGGVDDNSAVPTSQRELAEEDSNVELVEEDSNAGLDEDDPKEKDPQPKVSPL